ncbi:MAG: HAD-IB family phosphatase [Alphaproteobacteria bacterium]|nr:MAG: hypothetical protein B6I23_01240 [Rickettsiaceae bacterium 4572_127]
MKKTKLAIYDFDGTLYPNDTLVKFWKWSLRHRLKSWIMIPHAVFFLVIYCLGFSSKGYLKEKFMQFISVKNLQKDLTAFWKTTQPFSWVKSQFAKDRKKGWKIICISASPDFFLEYLAKKMNWDVLIATPTKKNHPLKLAGENCRGKEKIKYLNAWAKKNKINYSVEVMFSDRIVDKPLFDLAKKTFAVPESGIFYEGLPKK